MNIDVTFSAIDDAFPDAYGTLSALKDFPSFHEVQGRRHPSAIYSVSISTVGARILSVLNELAVYEGQYSGKGHSPDEPLTAAADHMLDALTEHVEDCKNILRCYFPDAKSFAGNPAAKAYMKAVEPYRDFVAHIDNYIKHSQGRIHLSGRVWDEGVCIGYYISGPTGPNTVGPNKDIHPTCRAFSFNRSIRYHMCQVYAIGEILSATVVKISGHAANLDNQINHVKASNWAKAIRAAANRPLVFFRDETPLDVPIIEVLPGDGIKISYPDTRFTPLSPPEKGGWVFGNFQADGVTRSFTIPGL